MITDKDIIKLKNAFATKEELADLRLDVGELKDDMRDVKKQINSFEEKFDDISNKLDYVVGSIKEI